LLLILGTLRVAETLAARLLLGLAVFALGHALLAWIDRDVAHALVRGVPAGAALDAAARDAGVVEAVATLGLVLSPCAVVVRAWRSGELARVPALLAWSAPLYAAALLCTFDVPALALHDHLAASARAQTALARAHARPLESRTAGSNVSSLIAVVAHGREVTLLDRDRMRVLGPAQTVPPFAGRRLTLLVDGRARVADLLAVLTRVPAATAVELGFVARADLPPRAVRRFELVRALAFTVRPILIHRRGDFIAPRVMREGGSELEASVGIDLSDLPAATLLKDLRFECDYLIGPSATSDRVKLPIEWQPAPPATP
jgi:hypothetical protein